MPLRECGSAAKPEGKLRFSFSNVVSVSASVDSVLVCTFVLLGGKSVRLIIKGQSYRQRWSELRKMMSPFIEGVEIVEVSWKIPNFGEFIPSGKKSWRCDVPDFRKVVFIGGRVPQAYSQSKSPPVKLEVTVSKVQVTPPVSLGNRGTAQWTLRFVVVSDKWKPALPPCSLRGKLLELKTLCCENTLVKGMKGGGDTGAFDLDDGHHDVVLFDQTDADGYLDKNDVSLNIHFKLEVKCSVLLRGVGNMMTGEFTELSNDFESFLNDPRNADVEIKMSQGGGQSFKCHKMILAVRSPVFLAMFSSGMKETQEGVVEVEDILPKTMEHFLSFIYCGRFQDSSWIQSLPELAFVSDKYDVKSLKNLCDSHLIRSVTLENAVTLGSIAEQHGLKNAAKEIRNFIAENAHGVTLNSDVDTSNCDAYFKVSYSVPSPPKRLGRL